MLQAYPTKNGTGVSLFGDYGDLKMLYETVHHFAETLNEDNKFQKGQHQVLMNFAYEIRKAYSGQRLRKKLSYYGDEVSLNYYGFQLVWTDILIFINALRCNAGYIQSNKQHQANLYMLEHVVEKALFEYDAEGANTIKNYIGAQINVCNEYVFIIYQAVHIKFVSDRPGKMRFRKIPDLLNKYFYPFSQEHKELISSFQKSAIEQNCEIVDLEFADFPDIKW